jgi:hypothetical protein
MGQKIIIFLVAATVVAPLCALCIFGPIVLGSAIAGIAAWIGGFDILVTTGLAIIVGAVLYGLVSWRRGKIDAAAKVAFPAVRTADRGPQ